MQLWNYYSSDGSQSNKKLHSNPQPKGRFNKNASLFFADKPNNYIDYQNLAVAQYSTDNQKYLPFKELMPFESLYSSDKVNMALNYFYHNTSLFFNSTILTDFSGPTIDVRYENFAEGSYNFTISLKNENNQTPTKVVNTRSKPITLKVIKNSSVSFKINDKEKLPATLPEKEIDISNYFEQRGFVGLFSPRDD